MGILIVIGISFGLLLRWSKNRLEEDPRVDALRAFSMRHNLRYVEGEGYIRVLGGHKKRAFSLSLQLSSPAVLLVGVDCGANNASGVTMVEDGVLASRWTNPSPDLFLEGRLEGLLEEMILLAEERERLDPESPKIE
jgi:hypothetical protein